MKQSETERDRQKYRDRKAEWQNQEFGWEKVRKNCRFVPERKHRVFQCIAQMMLLDK